MVAKERPLRAEGRRHPTTRSSRRRPERWEIRSNSHERHAGRKSLAPRLRSSRRPARRCEPRTGRGRAGSASNVSPTKPTSAECSIATRKRHLFSDTLRSGKLDTMGKLLKRAIEEAEKLPDSEQEAIGSWLLAEIESERRWDELFSRPPSEALKRMAEEALEDYRAGRTSPLDPDRL